jgi:predicted nucleic acid-binding protein
MGPVVVDSCVLIDVLRGYEPALAFLTGLEATPMVAAVTIAELFAGAYRRGEEALIDDLTVQLDVIPLDFSITRLAGAFCRRYGPSHGVQLFDATIAATAQRSTARLVTRNVRQFPMLDDLLVPYQ